MTVLTRVILAFREIGCSAFNAPGKQGPQSSSDTHVNGLELKSSCNFAGRDLTNITPTLYTLLDKYPSFIHRGSGSVLLAFYVHT